MAMFYAGSIRNKKREIKKKKEKPRPQETHLAAQTPPLRLDNAPEFEAHQKKTKNTESTQQ